MLESISVDLSTVLMSNILRFSVNSSAASPCTRLCFHYICNRAKEADLKIFIFMFYPLKVASPISSHSVFSVTCFPTEMCIKCGHLSLCMCLM